VTGIFSATEWLNNYAGCGFGAGVENIGLVGNLKLEKSSAVQSLG
jgi:hypothetical protein